MATVNYTARDIHRFWSKVSVTDNPKQCWEWIAGSNKQNYGNFRHGKKTKLSHRVAWEITYGEIHDGLLVRHDCDNPRCVNPNHLLLGTNSNNMQDKVKRGRHISVKCYGELNGQCKLTASQVETIRNRYINEKITQKSLAIEAGVSESQIQRIIAGKRWAFTEKQEQ